MKEDQLMDNPAKYFVLRTLTSIRTLHTSSIDQFNSFVLLEPDLVQH